MLLNFFPITFEFDKYDVDKIDYTQEKLTELRKLHNTTHSFFRSEDDIYVSNGKSSADLDIGLIPVTKRVFEDWTITSSLIKHIFFRTNLTKSKNQGIFCGFESYIIEVAHGNVYSTSMNPPTRWVEWKPFGQQPIRTRQSSKTVLHVARTITQGGLGCYPPTHIRSGLKAKIFPRTLRRLLHLRGKP